MKSKGRNSILKKDNWNFVYSGSDTARNDTLMSEEWCCIF